MDDPLDRPASSSKPRERGARRAGNTSLGRHRPDGPTLLELAPIPVFRDLPDHCKYLIRLILYVVRERATKLRFEPNSTDGPGSCVELYYESNAEIFALFPPPDEC
jgi:hypothetical protein